MTTELTYFLVTGNFDDIEDPNPSGTSNKVLFEIVSGLATFHPRLPAGFVAYISNLDLQTTPPSSANTALAIAPIQARFLGGKLQTINTADTPSIKLLSNSAPISSQLIAQNNIQGGQLIYDVNFADVVYAEGSQAVAPFGFYAPIDTTPVCLTGASLTRIPYDGP